MIIENKILLLAINTDVINNSLNIPDFIEGIGNNSCNNLNIESLFIPSSIKYIGKDAFKYNNIETIILDSNLTVDKGAFMNNPLKKVYLKKNNYFKITSTSFPSNTTLIIEDIFKCNNAVASYNMIVKDPFENLWIRFKKYNLSLDSIKKKLIKDFINREVHIIDENLVEGLIQYVMDYAKNNNLNKSNTYKLIIDYIYKNQFTKYYDCAKSIKYKLDNINNNIYNPLENIETRIEQVECLIKKQNKNKMNKYTMELNTIKDDYKSLLNGYTLISPGEISYNLDKLLKCINSYDTVDINIILNKIIYFINNDTFCEDDLNEYIEVFEIFIRRLDEIPSTILNLYKSELQNKFDIIFKEYPKYKKIFVQILKNDYITFYSENKGGKFKKWIKK